MVNKVILIGNLGRDPELTYTASGIAVAKVTLATTERWSGRDGEKKETTEWHNLVFWRRQAEIANEYLRKGSKIYAEGRIKYRSWEGQDGQKRYATDIEVQNFNMLSPRGEGGGGGGAPRQARPAQQQRSGGGKPAPQQQQRPQQQQDGGTYYEPLGNNQNFGSADDDDLPF